MTSVSRQVSTFQLTKTKKYVVFKFSSTNTVSRQGSNCTNK